MTRTISLIVGSALFVSPSVSRAGDPDEPSRLRAAGTEAQRGPGQEGDRVSACARRAAKVAASRPTRRCSWAEYPAGATGATGPSTSPANKERDAIGWSAPPGRGALVSVPHRAGPAGQARSPTSCAAKDSVHPASSTSPSRSPRRPAPDPGGRPQRLVRRDGRLRQALSHLSFSPTSIQRLSLTAWGPAQAAAPARASGNPPSARYRRLLQDEAAWGARLPREVKVPGLVLPLRLRPGPPSVEDRRVGRDAGPSPSDRGGSSERRTAARAPDAAEYQSSFRAGGSVAIAAPGAPRHDGDQEVKGAATTCAPPERGRFSPSTTRRSPTTGARHRRRILRPARGHGSSTGQRTSRRIGTPRTGAPRLVARLVPGSRSYWRADDASRPFFHAADAGLPATSLLAYLEVADEGHRKDVRKAVRTSLESEIAVTGEVANPFGYARQLVQTTAGVREARFFFPHDTETAPWWQGEDARLASLAFAARRSLAYFADDPAFALRLRRYAQDQLDWISATTHSTPRCWGRGATTPVPVLWSLRYTNAPGHREWHHRGVGTRWGSTSPAHGEGGPRLAGASNGCRTPPEISAGGRRASLPRRRRRWWPRDHRLRLRQEAGIGESRGRSSPTQLRVRERQGRRGGGGIRPGRRESRGLPACGA